MAAQEQCDWGAGSHIPLRCLSAEVGNHGAGSGPPVQVPPISESNSSLRKKEGAKVRPVSLSSQAVDVSPVAWGQCLGGGLNK